MFELQVLLLPNEIIKESSLSSQKKNLKGFREEKSSAEAKHFYSQHESSHVEPSST